MVRGGDVFLWSRGEELVTARFPEVEAAGRALPSGTVIDGELVPWRDGRVLPFGVLQTRIGRTNLTTRALREAPVVLLAFDVLEAGGVDVRARSQETRRATLEALLAPLPARGVLQLSPLVAFDGWEELGELRATSRSRAVEGIMLKARAAPYRVGRPRGEWWKWKIEPYTVDAVLVNAQLGHGRRASLYTDYTFAVLDGDQLVPVAKAYSGLTDEEIGRLDAWIRGEHAATLWTRSHGDGASRLRTRLRGDPALVAAQVGGGAALSADPALAHRQGGARRIDARRTRRAERGTRERDGSERRDDRGTVTASRGAEGTR